MALSSGKRAIELLIVVLMGVHLCSAEEYTVGGSSGWGFNVNYTNWASQYTFRVGDTLLFPYTAGEHDVVEVSASDYSSCSVSTAIATYTKTNATVTLSSEGKHYYLCSYTGHCSAGMLVEIDVLASSSTSPSPSPSSTPSLSPTPSSSPSLSPTPSSSPSSSPSSPSPSPSPSSSPSLSPTPSISPSLSPSPSQLSPALSPTPSPSTTTSPSGTPANSPSPTPSPENSPSNPSSSLAPEPASSSAISTKWVASSLLIASSLLF